jgi:glycosyltransferase involved in cell wall biosynthesis
MKADQKKLRVCYFGTYRAEYSRNQIMIEGLRRAGVEVIECQEPLWRSIEERVQAASGGWRSPAFLVRMLRSYARLLNRYRRVGRYDLMVVGYPGQLDVFLARLLTWLGGRKLAWDIFMSIYLVALERQLEQRSSFTIRMLGWVERLACRLPNLLILDTAQYVEWFRQTHGTNPQHFKLVPTGADDRHHQPLPSPGGDTPLRILYYGSFIPNHGVPTIIAAARLLQDEPDICFEMVGDGPEREPAERLAESWGLTTVQFTGWLQKDQLALRAASADILLGAFGQTPQSLMTVQNKIYEGLAMKKAVISGDSPAVREALTHGEHIYLCERNPEALAEAILALHASPELRSRLEQSGYQRFTSAYSLDQIGQRFAGHLQELAEKGGHSQS